MNMLKHLSLLIIIAAVCIIAFITIVRYMYTIPLPDTTKLQLPAEEVTIEQQAVMFSTDFQKRLFQPITSDESLNGLSPALLSTLLSSGEQYLVKLRCSERIVHDWESFFFREANTHKVTREILDEPFASLLASAKQSTESPRTILTARFCQTVHDDILFEYTTGELIGHHPDRGKDAETYLSYIKKGESFTPGLLLIQYADWQYPGCHTALQMTNDNVLYYECGRVAAEEVNATYHLIDFSRNSVRQISTCVYAYHETPQKICT
jgi:hypothetical protein